MKLNDLIESFQTQKSITTGGNRFINRKGLTGDKGAGVFAHVVPDNDPHMINRISHRHDPAYNKYANFLYNSKQAQKNPHFPRIYADKAFISTDKRETYPKRLWKMEKLPFTFSEYVSDPKDNAEALERIKNIANMYLESGMAKQFDDVELQNDQHEDRWMIVHLGDRLLRVLCEIKNIELESFREALQFLMDNKTGKFDVHGDNIMVRTTPQGPQLVFTDPFSWG